MKEEIQNSGMELNEAALENVSGGRVSESQRPHAQSVAERICRGCELQRHNLCAQGPSGLADVLMEQGITSIHDISHCPFYLAQLHKGGSK